MALTDGEPPYWERMAFLGHEVVSWLSKSRSGAMLSLGQLFYSSSHSLSVSLSPSLLLPITLSLSLCISIYLSRNLSLSLSVVDL